MSLVNLAECEELVSLVPFDREDTISIFNYVVANLSQLNGRGNHFWALSNALGVLEYNRKPTLKARRQAFAEMIGRSVDSVEDWEDKAAAEFAATIRAFARRRSGAEARLPESVPDDLEEKTDEESLTGRTPARWVVAVADGTTGFVRHVVERAKDPAVPDRIQLATEDARTLPMVLYRTDVNPPSTVVLSVHFIGKEPEQVWVSASESLVGLMCGESSQLADRSPDGGFGITLDRPAPKRYYALHWRLL